MQPNYMRSVDPRELEQLLNAQQLVLERCARNNTPVFLVEMIGDPATDARISKTVAKITPGTLYRKPSRNAFTCNYLEEGLQKHNIDNLILSGLLTSECVLATAEAALTKKAISGKPYRLWTSPALMADGEVDCISTQGEVIVPTFNSLQWYAKNTNYHPNVASLLKTLDDNI